MATQRKEYRIEALGEPHVVQLWRVNDWLREQLRLHSGAHLTEKGQALNARIVAAIEKVRGEIHAARE